MAHCAHWFADGSFKTAPPLFALSLWNCYTAVTDNLPKANNSVESWHRGFSQLLGAHHPSIWKFIDGLKKEQSLNKLKIE